MFSVFKKKLILVGSRRNLDDIVSAAQVCGYKIIGILDEHYWGNTEKICGIPVIGSEEELLDPKNKWRKYNFFPANWWDGKQAIGDNTFDGDQLRKERLDLLDKAEVRVINLIMDPHIHWFTFKKNFKVGKGVLILAGAKIGSDVEIDDYCAVDWDVRLVSSHLGRNTIVGVDTTLAHVKTGKNVRIGVRSTLIPSRKKSLLTVGDNAIIYIGSLVLDDVPTDSVYTMHGKTRKRFTKTA
jgi:acetyltransferase-like isoleucine patch superfamily enzyme